MTSESATLRLGARRPRHPAFNAPGSRTPGGQAFGFGAFNHTRPDAVRPFAHAPRGNMIDGIVESRMSEYGPAIERLVDLAVRGKIASMDPGSKYVGAHASRCDNTRHPRVERAVAEALSDVQHVLKVSFAGGDDYWPVYVLHDSERRATLQGR